MGRDKGTLPFGGEPQAARALAVLEAVCDEVLVSIRPEQAAAAPYKDLPTVPDVGSGAGPAAGLIAAWQRHPGRALLVLAADMPLVDEPTLAALVASRDPARIATAFRHPDGTPEPLCTIWEPDCAAELARRAAAGDRSLRRFLLDADAALVTPPFPDRLVSVNDPEAYACALARQDRDLR